MFILKVLKVICFDIPWEVLILKGLQKIVQNSPGPCEEREGPGPFPARWVEETESGAGNELRAGGATGADKLGRVEESLCKCSELFGLCLDGIQTSADKGQFHRSGPSRTMNNIQEFIQRTAGAEGSVAGP